MSEAAKASDSELLKAIEDMGQGLKAKHNTTIDYDVMYRAGPTDPISGLQDSHVECVTVTIRPSGGERGGASS